MKEIKFTGDIGNVSYNTETIGRMGKGRPLADAPKTYKKVGVVEHNIGNNYNSYLLVVFKAKDGTYRYEIYRDGSIYPYYGKFEIVKS